jgi:hypothetical protein
MTADELVNASKEIQEKWLKETKIDFKVDYEYVGCFVEEGQVDDDPGDVCTYSELKCGETTVYAFFIGTWSYYVYHNLKLFGIYKSAEEGKDLVSKLDNFAG